MTGTNVILVSVKMVLLLISGSEEKRDLTFIIVFQTCMEILVPLQLYIFIPVPDKKCN